MSGKISAVIMMVLFFVSGMYGAENSTDLYKKGASLAINGRIDESIHVFKKVIKINPYYCLGHYGLGKAYLFKYGMMDEAVKHLKKAVSLDKRFARGHFYLGMAYMFSKKYVRAIHAYKTAFRYDDTIIEALYNIGVMYDITGNRYNADYYFKKFIHEKTREEEDLIF